MAVPILTIVTDSAAFASLIRTQVPASIVLSILTTREYLSEDTITELAVLIDEAAISPSVSATLKARNGRGLPRPAVLVRSRGVTTAVDERTCFGHVLTRREWEGRGWECVRSEIVDRFGESLSQRILALKSITRTLRRLL